MVETENISFCPDCKDYEICKNSIYGLEFVEKMMIFKSLSKIEGGSFRKRVKTIIKKTGFKKKRLKRFLIKREENCLYC